MARPQVLASAVCVLLTAGAAAAPQAGQARRGQAAAAVGRPFEALLARLATTAPGTYIVHGAALVPAPEEANIPVMLQADVRRGPDRGSRVAIVVGAQTPRPVDVRLQVRTVATGGEASRVKLDADGPGASGPTRFVHEMNLSPGDYDLEAIVGHPVPGGGEIAAIAKARLTIPDVRGGALTATPIVAGEAGTGARRVDAPFSFGRTTLAPALSPLFSQDGSLSVAFRVYNWTAKPEEKPDLTVEYLFYEQGSKGLHFFNKAKPQRLTAETLGTAFDASAGVVTAGMLIPLGAFTLGDFQLVAKVTDNRNQQIAEQRIRFTVAP